MKQDKFILQSLKVLSTGIFAKYQEDGNTAVITHEDPKRASHPDLSSALDKLQTYFDKIFNTEDRGTEVKGILFKSENVQITGMIEAQNGALCSLNTPYFNLTENEFGLNEKDLLHDIGVLKTETFLYLFKKKAAQQEIEFKEEKAASKKD